MTYYLRNKPSWLYNILHHHLVSEAERKLAEVEVGVRWVLAQSSFFGVLCGERKEGLTILYIIENGD